MYIAVYLVRVVWPQTCSPRFLGRRVPQDGGELPLRVQHPASLRRLLRAAAGLPEGLLGTGEARHGTPLAARFYQL